MKAVETEKKGYNYIYWLGVLLWPLLIPLDWAIYPGQKKAILCLRIGIIIYFLAARYISLKLSILYSRLLMQFTLVLSGIIISLMCVITGEGFASPYYAGLLIIVVATAVLVDIRPKYYAMTIALIVADHFLLMSFCPWDLKGFLINVFFLVTISCLGILTQYKVYTLIREVKTLTGFIPICAKCKKIRDDKGFWDQLERYLSKHADVVFTHGLCPDCVKEYEKEMEDLK